MATGIGHRTPLRNSKLGSDIHAANVFINRCEIALIVLVSLWCRILSDDEDINRAWESIKENIKSSSKESLGLHELKQHKPWFDEEC
jgi:hypothetical protein